MSKLGSGAPKCPTCGKSVYFNEQVLALEKAWHKRCLKCAKCAKVLDPGKLSDRDGQVYCDMCYAAVAGIKGYGHGHNNEYANSQNYGGAHSRSHISGGAAGVSAGAVVLQGSEVDTPANTGALSGASGTARYCSSCGVLRGEGANFCAGCGSKY